MRKVFKLVYQHRQFGYRAPVMYITEARDSKQAREIAEKRSKLSMFPESWMLLNA